MEEDEDEMLDAPLTTCGRCGRPAEPFGRMRHRFVDGKFHSICVTCARDLVPEQVARAEEMDRQWGIENTKKD